MATTLYFIRHAAADDDGFDASALDREMRGADDPPLTSRGRSQARKLAPAIFDLGATRLVSSTLARAVETASIINSATGISHTDQLATLNEVRPGQLASETLAELARRSPGTRLPRRLRRRVDAAWYRTVSTAYFVQWLRGRTNDGDDPESVRARVDDVLDQLAQMPEERVAVVGHGYWIFYMVMRCLGAPPSYRSDLRPWVENCSVTTLVGDGDGYRLERFAQRFG